MESFQQTYTKMLPGGNGCLNPTISIARTTSMTLMTQMTLMTVSPLLTLITLLTSDDSNVPQEQL
jgi:hypothetical protein